MNDNKVDSWQGRAFLSQDELGDVDAVAGGYEVYKYPHLDRYTIDVDFAVTLGDETIRMWISDIGDPHCSLENELVKIEKLRDFLSLFLREIERAKEVYLVQQGEKEAQEMTNE